jgi:hypothetical protein
MDDKTAAALRAPFPAEKVGKLPKIWCGACSKAAKERRTCEQNDHVRSVCKVCKANITTAHMHVDYVGHADVTDRLLSVDPTWNWEPLAYDERGLPALDQHTGLWIRLTVAGTPKLGYGHPDGKAGGDAVKEAIGDAIRNAAMRFGVALDLWRKERAGAGDPVPNAKAREGSSEILGLKNSIVAVAKQKGLPAVELIEADFDEWSQGKELSQASAAVLAEYLAALKRRPNGGDS